MRPIHSAFFFVLACLFFLSVKSELTPNTLVAVDALKGFEAEPAEEAVNRVLIACASLSQSEITALHTQVPNLISLLTEQRLSNEDPVVSLKLASILKIIRLNGAYYFVFVLIVVAITTTIFFVLAIIARYGKIKKLRTWEAIYNRHKKKLLSRERRARSIP